MEYDIEIWNFAGEKTIGIEAECQDDAAAINWAYYYLGKYRGDRAKVWRGDSNPRDASTFVTEISSQEDARR